jgi:cytochrome c oxidase subunit 2
MKMSNKLFGYLLELAWILPSVAIPIAFLVAITLTAFAVGITVPGNAGRVDPQAINSTTPFDKPGVRELAPDRYEVVVIGQTFRWDMGQQGNEPIRIKAGSKVTFIATSRDVIHGLKIENTPINMMIIPGQISRLTTTFDKPGEYTIFCHEFCGGGHHVMAARLVVE